MARSLVLVRRFGAAALVVAVLAGCSPTKQDFRRDAEAFLRSDDMYNTYGLDLPEPRCEQPAALEPGETMTCVAAASTGERYRFTFEVTGDRELTLEAIDFAG